MGTPLFGCTTIIIILREELTRFALGLVPGSNSSTNLWQKPH